MSTHERVIQTLDFIQIRKEHFLRLLRSCDKWSQTGNMICYYEELKRQIHNHIQDQEKHISLFCLREYREPVYGALERMDRKYLRSLWRQNEMIRYGDKKDDQ